jgi:hydrogenase-4 component E
MTDWMNLLIGFAMGLNLLALASSRLPSIIRTAAVQGMPSPLSRSRGS